MSSRSTTNLGQEFRISDCYVWFEINYLDSATDYREYLPQRRIGIAPAPAILDDDLILLDSSSHSCGGDSCLCVALLALFVTICCALWYELL
jgi:hypothetical protein